MPFPRGLFRKDMVSEAMSSSSISETAISLVGNDAFLSESELLNVGELFWCPIFNIKGAVVNPFLSDLSIFALKLFNLPISNVTAETAFSGVTSEKYKIKESNVSRTVRDNSQNQNNFGRMRDLLR
ncbi:hypothetical protein TNCV_3116591 [Trichonephila clavipes]|nr:hypothetical protein TNCV_3116591 [Trichonephila clavipes]